MKGKHYSSDRIRRPHHAVLCITLAALMVPLLVQCGGKQYFREASPASNEYVVYSQAFNLHQFSASTQQQGNYQVTRTEHSSRQDILEGMPLFSKEKPRQAGKPWVRDCNFK